VEDVINVKEVVLNVMQLIIVFLVQECFVKSIAAMNALLVGGLFSQ